jgi:hypothetical protein
MKKEKLKKSYLAEPPCKCLTIIASYYEEMV